MGSNQIMGSASPVRALHVCSISPAAGQTGYEIRVVEEVRLLRQQGINVAILCFVRKDQFFPIGQLLTLYRRLRKITGARVFIVPTAHFFDLQFPPGGDPRISWAISFFARLHRARITHGQALYSTMHLLRTRPRLNARILFEVHGASPEETEMSGGSTNRVKMLAEWEQEALRSADHFNFVSYKMKDYFNKKYNLNVSNYSIIPCCVHTEMFSISWDERERKRKELRLADRFIIVYLGTLTVWQWPEVMFALVEQLRKHKPEMFLYLLIPKSDHGKAQEFIQKHNIPNDSYRLEEVPHEKVGSVLGVADAGLLLRKKHPVNEVASPTKFGEYLAAGIPIIITDGIGDTSDIVRREKVGITLTPSDNRLNVQDFEKLILFCKEVFQNRQLVACRCFVVANNHLEWKKYSGTLVESYKQIMGT